MNLLGNKLLQPSILFKSALQRREQRVLACPTGLPRACLGKDLSAPGFEPSVSLPSSQSSDKAMTYHN